MQAWDASWDACFCGLGEPWLQAQVDKNLVDERHLTAEREGKSIGGLINYIITSIATLIEAEGVSVICRQI